MKFKLDPRTGEYRQVEVEPFRISMRMGGIYIDDDRKGLTFMIHNGTSKIEIYRGDRSNPEKAIKAFGVAEAHKIADYVKRTRPASKYTDWRYFCRNVENPVTDDVYASESAQQYVNVHGIVKASQLLENQKDKLNEDDWFDTQGPTTQGQSQGTKIHGWKGFLKSLPSAILATVICWPAALLQLIGSLHIRSEKRWRDGVYAGLINTNVWKDFIQTPYDKNKDDTLWTQKEFDEHTKEEKDAYLRRMYIKNNRFYWAELSNGEIIRVIGASEDDAKNMAVAIIKKIKPTYAKLNAKVNASKHISSIANAAKTYKVILDDGEIALWCALTEDQVKKEVRDSRKLIIDAYKEAGIIPRDSDQVRKKYYPAVNKLEDLGVGTPIEEPKEDKNYITIYDHEPHYQNDRFGNVYKIDTIHWIKFFITALKAEDVEPIMERIVENRLFKRIYEANRQACANNKECFKITMGSDDEFILFADPDNYPSEIEANLRKITSRRTAATSSITANNVATAMAITLEEHILKSIKDFYRGAKGASKLQTTNISTAKEEPLTGSAVPSNIGWNTDAKMVMINPDTGVETASTIDIKLKDAA